MKEFIKSIGNFLEFGTKLVDPQQYDIKVMKQFAYRVESAMSYVSVDEKTGIYESMDDKHIKKYKLHFRKRIFNVR